MASEETGGATSHHRRRASGSDTVNFGFAFAGAAVTAGSNYTEISINPTVSTITVYHLTRAETLVFTDRTIALNDGNPLVDDLYYLGRYADVARGGLDADAHYNQYGWREGRDPDAYFSTTGYLAANPDVRAAALNPLEHYIDMAGRKNATAIPRPVSILGYT